jgi:hypothetical protein
VRSLRFGQPIATSAHVEGSAEPQPVAAFGPDGTLVAMLTDRGSHARSLFVVPASS